MLLKPLRSSDALPAVFMVQYKRRGAVISEKRGDKLLYRVRFVPASTTFKNFCTLTIFCLLHQSGDTAISATNIKMHEYFKFT